jgi:REP element-mobilizing transposase RayT
MSTPFQPDPEAYFITWPSYGTWLHGDERGSVDRQQNQYAHPMLEPDAARFESESDLLKEPPFVMTEQDRVLVLAAIREVCEYRKWKLYAVHVRSNHVHIVVAGTATPERMMRDFKAYASRALNRIHQRRKYWARHGSTKYLFSELSVEQSIQYTLHEQGTPMACWPETN